MFPKFFGKYIWGSPALKFWLHQKTVGQNGAEKILNACKIQTTGPRDFKYGLKWPHGFIFMIISCSPKFFSQYLWFPCPQPLNFDFAQKWSIKMWRKIQKLVKSKLLALI